ncbi:glucoamylase family protein [Nguyenibacter vanlangensis]|uniref:Glucoamylase family protein n=1 Tax=Nguyenibacter vanlangensis TaxID=1216886 RepID=A0ABZ3DAF0_9PROT
MKPARPPRARRRRARLGLACAIGWAGLSLPPPSRAADARPAGVFVPGAADRAFVDDLEHRTFTWFWDAADPQNGLIPDHYPSPDRFASIAAVGFGLTAYGIGAERGYVTRAQAVARTLATLRFFAAAPQNATEDGAAGYRGFYYHFLDPRRGVRFARWSELSSVDTTLLLGGVLFAQSYYDRDTPPERAIRRLADRLYRRVDWAWMRRRAPLLAMGWTPSGRFLRNDWDGYNEGMLIYLLALASPTHPVPAGTWQAWTGTYARQWGRFQGQTLLNFAPLFGHQYSESWIDFRGIRDGWSRDHDLDYFENSRRATYAQRAYAQANPGGWRDYGPDIWGLTACNGPGIATRTVDGRSRSFLAYSARGAGRDYVSDDGTIAPTAAGGSIAFAPEIALPALEAMKARYGTRVYDRYGFVDAFNPSFAGGAPHGASPGSASFWADTEQFGIDQGPILLMIENWRSGLVWTTMKKNPYIRAGLIRAGFTGGWLDGLQRQARGDVSAHGHG